jgi:hypothetical protein
MKYEYWDLLENEHDAEMAGLLAWTFHHLNRDASWGKVPWPCSWSISHSRRLCRHGTPFTSIFDPKDTASKNYVAAETRLRKKTQKLRGAAEPKPLTAHV